MVEAKRTYGVKLVRGPLVRIPPHPLACDSADDLVRDVGGFTRPLAADLFCGAGGLSFGLQEAGFDVVVGVDHDPDALETYAGLFPGVALNRDLAEDRALDEVVELLKAINVTLIAGGPPCQPFSRAGSSKIRSLVQAGTRGAHDHRRDMWESFLEVVARVLPPAVLLENVPEMALGDDVRIVRTLVNSLETLGYGVHTRLLHAFQHGVPQFRQRFMLVAVEGGRGFVWPRPERKTTTVGDAIMDLPPVEGGWRPTGGAEGWTEWVPSTVSDFARRARRGMTGPWRARVQDHITRPVRPDDRVIFNQMEASTLYTDIHESLRRYRADIFDDKYKRLGLDEPSRSITAHIARDGYWYIHPTQPRTLTVREAARIQTFPDRVRFAGTPSKAFRQIGNAVPPRLAERVGKALIHHLDGPEDTSAMTTRTSARLAEWYLARDELSKPWLLSTPWGAAQGEMLLQRIPKRKLGDAWERIEKLDSAELTIDHADTLREVGASVGRDDQAKRIMDAATWACESDATDTLALVTTNPFVPPQAAAAACLAAGVGIAPLLCSGPVLRVAARVTGQAVDEHHRLSQGRLQVARLVGGSLDEEHDETSLLAMAALVELSSDVCVPRSPNCNVCPLVSQCASAPSLSRRSPGRSQRVT